MWFHKAQARAFGPLRSDKDDRLEFVSGLNVVHGPNEAGKSSWHAALMAALCGRRRGPGRTKEETALVEQHRPWSSGDDGPWAVTVEMERDTGSRIRIDRDLRLNETTISDPGLGDRRLVDLESEITHDGSPDGALLVGLSRNTFAMAASVRQASVISDLENPDALQQHLARAAAGSDDATAARALERIDSFRKVHVGSERKGGVRPVQTTKEAEERARSELATVREQHMSYLAFAEEADRLRKAVTELETQQQRIQASAEYSRARGEAAQLDSKIQELESLSSRAGGGQVPELPDVTLLAQAVSSVGVLPDPATTSLETAAVLERRSAELEVEIEEFPPTPEVAQVLQWVVPLRRVAGPGSASASTNKVPHKPGRRRLAAAAAAVVGSAVAVMLSITVGVVVGIGIGAASGVAVFLLGMRRRAPAESEGVRPPDAAEVQTAYERLDEVALPQDADAAVREAAERRENLRALQDQLAATTRDLKQRRNMDTAWAGLRRAAARHDIDAANDDELLAQVDGWLSDHAAIQQERDEAYAARGALEEALEDQSLDEWKIRASEARRAAAEAQQVFEALGGSGDDVGDVNEIQRCLEQLDKDLRKARSDADTAAGELKGIDPASVDIAGAEAELAEAFAERERVRQLDETLSTTARFMQQAADNAHRVFAPRIEAEVGALVSRVTNGRYRSVRVDPADLRVRLVTESGDRRDARDVSRGTTEQVYLALRIVLAEVLSTGRERCPLLLDDPTVHADSDRKMAILECLLAVADDRQVILFSQEQQVLDWARSRSDAGVHLIELGPAQPA